MTITATPERSDVSPRSERIRIRAIQMLYGAGIFPAVMHVFVAFVVGWVLWDANSPLEIVPWFIVLTVAVIFRGILVWQHGGDKFDPHKADHLLRLFNIGAVAVGLSWGFAGWFFFPPDDPAGQIFLTFVVGGMAMSSISTLHVRMRTCLMTVLPGILPLAIRYMIEPGDLSQVYGSLLFGYTLVLVATMRRQSQSAMLLFGLQIENENLLEEAAQQAIELDTARQSAEAANIAKSRFLAQASHDLRQPLHAINLYVEALPVPTGDNVSARIIGRVRQSLDVLSRLFDSLLDVTLLDTGQIKVRPIVFRSGDLFDQISNEFSGIAEAGEVELRVRSSDLAVRSDPVLLRRILQNLCSNAIRYTDGGAMLLAIRREGKGAAIEVYDTGGGISEKDQTRVFEEFTRLDAARMGGAVTPGLGLGLAIVKRLADVLGLTVSVRSQEGRGTRFRISGIPIAPANEVIALQDEASGVGEDALAGVRILIIDDDQDTLDAGRELLCKWGCDVEIMLGWKGVPHQLPDIIICDYELGPGVTGFDAIEAMYQAGALKIPTILISGNSTPELRQQVKERDIPMIHKPVRPGQLRSALLHVAAGLRKAAG